jgi:hypothetical protein
VSLRGASKRGIGHGALLVYFVGFLIPFFFAIAHVYEWLESKNSDLANEYEEYLIAVVDFFIPSQSEIQEGGLHP